MQHHWWTLCSSSLVLFWQFSFSYELEDKASQIKKAKQKGSTRVKRKTDIWALGQNKDRTKKITKWFFAPFDLGQIARTIYPAVYCFVWKGQDFSLFHSNDSWLSLSLPAMFFEFPFLCELQESHIFFWQLHYFSASLKNISHSVWRSLYPMNKKSNKLCALGINVAVGG